MSNINDAPTRAPPRVEDRIDVVTAMRQKHCKHVLIRGACDSVKRCVHCGISESEIPAPSVYQYP